MSTEQVCFLFADAYQSLVESCQLLRSLQSRDTEFCYVLRESLLVDAKLQLRELQLHSQPYVVPTACTNLVSQMLYVQDHLDSRRTCLMFGTKAFQRPQQLAAFLEAAHMHQAVVLATPEVREFSPGIRCDADGTVEELTNGGEAEFHSADGMLLLASGRLALAPAMQAVRRERPAAKGSELLSIVNDAVLLGIEVKACDYRGCLIAGRPATIPFKFASSQVGQAG